MALSNAVENVTAAASPCTASSRIFPMMSYATATHVPMIADRYALVGRHGFSNIFAGVDIANGLNQFIEIDEMGFESWTILGLPSLDLRRRLCVISLSMRKSGSLQVVSRPVAFSGYAEDLAFRSHVLEQALLQEFSHRSLPSRLRGVRSSAR